MDIIISNPQTQTSRCSDMDIMLDNTTEKKNERIRRMDQTTSAERHDLSAKHNFLNWLSNGLFGRLQFDARKI